MRYVVYSTKESETSAVPSYWSNENGWGDLQTADIFTQEQHDTMYLPLFGEWQEVYLHAPKEGDAEPCPFCGELPTKWMHEGKEVIECRNENCPIYYEYLGSIFVEKWNIRPIEAKLKHEIEKLKGVLSGDPNLTATKNEREVWQLTAVRTANRLEEKVRHLEIANRNLQAKYSKVDELSWEIVAIISQLKVNWVDQTVDQGDWEEIANKIIKLFKEKDSDDIIDPFAHEKGW